MHWLFIINKDKAECLDCRRVFDLPPTETKLKRSPQGFMVPYDVETSEQRLAKLTPDYKYPYAGKVGRCPGIRLVYVNTSSQTVSLTALGYNEPIAPGQTIELGERVSSKTVKAYAPQLVCLDNVKRVETCGLDLFPFTVEELIQYTTHTGELFHHVGFVSPRP